MKATGIVRRIDDLGRIVVPKEIRRTLRIREGDPLEIFTDREGEIILKIFAHRRIEPVCRGICRESGAHDGISGADHGRGSCGRGVRQWQEILRASHQRTVGGDHR